MKGMKGFLLCAGLLILALVLAAQTPQWQWAVGAGGTENDYVQFIAIDSQGNQYVAGAFSGIASFGDHTLTSSGYDDIFVAKLDSAGNWLWAVSAGGISWWDAGSGIDIDGVGNAYLTGEFWGTAIFGTHTLTSSGFNDIFAAKLDPNGNWLWAVSAGGLYIDYGLSIAVDSAGNALLTGNFRYTASFGDHTLPSNGSEGGDIFVAKLDHNGNWLWAVKAGGIGADAGTCIAVDSAGNAFLTGYFEGTASFGPHTLTSSGYEDIFAAKLDPAGNWLWAMSAGGASYDSGVGIAVDSAGNALLTGAFQVTASFGAHTLTSSGSYDIFAAKLDPTGNWLWAKRAGGALWNAGSGIAVDEDGNAYLTGAFEGNASFGTHTINSSGDRDIFAAKLDPAGNWLWAVRAGGTGYEYGEGIAVDSGGNAFLTGNVFLGPACFGDHTIISSGGYDIFVAKLGSGTPVDEDLIPETSALSRLYDAYPNPLRPGQTAMIKTNVAERETGIFTVLNLRGQVISRHALGPGSHQISFASGNLPSGVYLYQLQTPS
ncbi:MAG: T9SS type A sorting domain-containing protein, partial [Candidatus Syntrophosphaera sp.]|nr:T9SS type A sorting domain-containing protein [Candidatus Syntrophosphaera sp.]